MLISRYSQSNAEPLNCHLNCFEDVLLNYEIKNIYGTQGLEYSIKYTRNK